jgi:hypothetical protein
MESKKPRIISLYIALREFLRSYLNSHLETKMKTSVVVDYDTRQFLPHPENDQLANQERPSPDLADHACGPGAWHR